MRTSSAISFLLGTAVALAGCAVSEGDELCDVAAAHVEECTGAPVEVNSCDEAMAEYVLEQSCESLAAGDGKADGLLCSGLGFFCDDDKGEDPTGKPTRYPILLVKGLGMRIGFSKAVRDALQADGHARWYSETKPFGTIEENARKLARSVDWVLRQTGASKVNIIAHSKGGLDSRYLISVLGYGNKVASLTTLGTPHRGSTQADIVLGASPGIAQSTVQKIVEWYGDGSEEDGDVYAALRDLTVSGAAERNRSMPNVAGVYYQSFAGLSSLTGIPLPGEYAACTAEGGAWLLEGSRDRISSSLIPHNSVEGRPSDGVVSVSSAHWGDFRGCVAADHQDLVGMPSSGYNRRTKFHPVRFIRSIAFELAAKGY